MVQAVKCLTSKHKTLSSIPSMAKKTPYIYTHIYIHIYVCKQIYPYKTVKKKNVFIVHYVGL
jgi:hypothetical protein